MSTQNLTQLAANIVNNIFNNPDALWAVCTPDLVVRHLWGKELRGAETIIPKLDGYPSGCMVTVHDCFGEDERVAVRFEVEIPLESEAPIVRHVIEILHFSGGKLSEWWGAFDRLVEQQQHGEQASSGPT